MVASLWDKACCHVNNCWKQAASLSLLLLTVIPGISLSVCLIFYIIVLLHAVDVTVLMDTSALHCPLDCHVHLLMLLPKLISQKVKLWKWGIEKYCGHWAWIANHFFSENKKCWPWIKPKDDMFLIKYCSSELPLGLQKPNRYPDRIALNPWKEND